MTNVIGAYCTIRWNDNSMPLREGISGCYFSFEPNPTGDPDYVYPLSGKADEEVFYVCDDGMPELLALGNLAFTEETPDFTVLSIDELVYEEN